MKAHELTELTQEEVEIKLADSLEELYNLRFQHAMHQLNNPIRLKEVKKDIARLKTFLKEFDLGIRTPKGIARTEEESKAES